MRREHKTEKIKTSVPPQTMHRLSLYVVAITALLTILGLTASLAIGMLWTSSLEPAMDGQKVLELRSEESTKDAH